MALTVKALRQQARELGLYLEVRNPVPATYKSCGRFRYTLYAKGEYIGGGDTLKRTQEVLTRRQRP